ncbi:MAG: transposase [Planctomycetes bacterium]|nr:transposase [Planctomycetota bacterium]
MGFGALRRRPRRPDVVRGSASALTPIPECVRTGCCRASTRTERGHPCRYLSQPPIATQRLALTPNGRVVYGPKRHWRDGTSAVSFDPLSFAERPEALVPSPRAHQLTYHGVLAPAYAHPLGARDEDWLHHRQP